MMRAGITRTTMAEECAALLTSWNYAYTRDRNE